MIFEAIECVTPREVAEIFVTDIRHDRIPCPFHNGRDRNMSVRPGEKTCRCFVCSRSWNAVSLYGAFTGISDRVEAAKGLAKEFGIEIGEETDEARRARETSERARKEKAQLAEEGRRMYSARMSRLRDTERRCQGLLDRYPFDNEKDEHTDEVFRIVGKMGKVHDEIENMMGIDLHDDEWFAEYARNGGDRDGR